ncbi:cell wall-binding repeat-containing protein [Euzebya sp.]|uniref:cell wall-binding repeat-containing protein n=1 Tax=Euzebya sp. TaxID=1971409 RepID=UPI0035169D27
MRGPGIPPVAARGAVASVVVVLAVALGVAGLQAGPVVASTARSPIGPVWQDEAGAGGPLDAGGSAPTWAVAGCVQDAQSDVVDLPARTPADVPRADITRFCVDHAESGLSVSMAVRVPTDPTRDPVWESVGAAVAFGYETTGGHRRVINLLRPGSEPRFEYHVLEPGADPVGICSGAASVDDGTYRATIPADCLDAPEVIEIGAQMFYDMSDGPESGAFDAAPGDGGFVAVPRTAPAGAARATRLAGPTRVETAIATAQALYADGTAGAVVLARADAFPDALVAAPLAAALDAPVLLTPRESLSPAVGEEIRRLVGERGDVVLLGGVAALAPAVEDALTAAGHTTTRLAGASRYDTAVAAARAAGPLPRTVVLAGGADFPDALLAGAAAPAVEGVALLVDPAGVPEVVEEYLAEVPDADVIVVGDVARRVVADADGTAAALNPSATSVALLDLYADESEVVLASVEDFPDGLAGGAYAAIRGVPLLLTPAEVLETSVRDALAERGPYQRITVMGGPDAVSDTVAGQAAAHLVPRTAP